MQKLLIPGSIVIAGALIAGALYFSGGGTGNQYPDPIPGQVLEPIRAAQADDHIIGNPDAKVVIVEYSDAECPFCKLFHETMHQVVDSYSGDQVAWVFRHWPIPQLHAKATKEAEALECAAELGGNEGFWKFTDRVFETTQSNDSLDIGVYNPGATGTGTDAGQLSDIAVEVGFDKAAFESCLASGRHAERVQRDANEVQAAGGMGTPHSIMIVGDVQTPIEGAQPLEAVKAMIDAAL